MINKDRLTSLFVELVSIDNPSRHEREMCDRLKKELDELNISYEEDNAGELIDGNCGNLYAYVDGDLDAKPIILSAHMDSVDPAVGKKAILTDLLHLQVIQYLALTTYQVSLLS